MNKNEYLANTRDDEDIFETVSTHLLYSEDIHSLSYLFYHHLTVYRHEHEAVAVQQLTKIKDMKSLSRLVRETTAQAQHQTNHLLGQVIIYLKVRLSMCCCFLLSKKLIYTQPYNNTNAFRSNTQVIIYLKINPVRGTGLYIAVEGNKCLRSNTRAILYLNI